MNTETELINGFGDVMKHIKEQEQRIKDLEKDNEGLKMFARHKSSQYETLKKQKESESYKKKNEQLIIQKQELEAKVDEAQVAFEENKKYKKEIDTLRDAVENECQASGIMEIMNMRIEEAEKKATEQEILKVAFEKECEKEVSEKMELHKEINELADALDSAEIYKCNECREYFPSRGMEDVFHRNYEPVSVCLECRDEHYTQCDECMDNHHNCNITTVWNETGHQDIYRRHDVCHQCNEDNA